MPRSLLRYTQVRRLGTPNVQESDAAYAEGRYFEANCLSSDLVNHFVRVTGNTLSVPNVTRVDVTDSTKMPAVGVIVQKPTATTCLVQVSGQITSFSPVAAGSWYYVGASSFPVAAPPSFPGIPQVVGLGLDTARLLLQHGFGPDGFLANVENEVPTGTIDGVNVTFTTVLPFRTGSTRFYFNGVRQLAGVGADYSEGPGLQTLTLAIAPRVGDHLLVDYDV